MIYGCIIATFSKLRESDCVLGWISKTSRDERVACLLGAELNMVVPAGAS